MNRGTGPAAEDRSAFAALLLAVLADVVALAYQAPDLMDEELRSRLVGLRGQLGIQGPPPRFPQSPAGRCLSAAPTTSRSRWPAGIPGTPKMTEAADDGVGGHSARSRDDPGYVPVLLVIQRLTSSTAWGAAVPLQMPPAATVALVKALGHG